MLPLDAGYIKHRAQHQNKKLNRITSIDYVVIHESGDVLNDVWISLRDDILVTLR